MVRFITFEGGEGTGKTTQVALLASYLSERARSCVVTREPGGTALGKMIRKTLLQVDDLAIAPATELPIGNPGTETTLIARSAEPLPDAGLTCSHGWLGVAVHVTVPAPLCRSRTTCAAVCDTNVVPVVTALKRNAVLSSVICGPVGMICKVTACDPEQPLD